ncbi:protein kinase [Streptomyces sp. NPDC006879]|uniref:protein kinase domain-containing protein n=1 Tax=Streptomyces sp. NPDC006879 TaxID=3364767 RepID=UPI00367C3D72
MKPLEAGDPTSVGNDRYRLVGRLGQGGMGVVYLGRSPSGRLVAVKVVRPELSTEPGFRRRFAEEVRAARRVGGFHTAPVVDADPDGDPAWLVTAYVAGPTLQAVLNRVGRLPEDTLTVLAAGLAEALEAIHRAGVIHRDFKPANIIVAEDGPRVIDFGIARALDGTALTQTGFQIGTPGFLAPEQLTGGAVTPAVDMFALGVVLCQASGGSAFGDGPSPALHYKAVHEEPDLSAVPESLHGVVAACLAKDPLQRPTPQRFLDSLTVRHRADGGWLPEAASQLLARPDGAAPLVPQEAAPTAEDLPTASAAVAEAPAVSATELDEAGANPSAPVDTDRPEGRPTSGAEVPKDGSLPDSDTDSGGRRDIEPGSPGAGTAAAPNGARRRRRLAVGLVVLLGACATSGLLVWRPWEGSAPQDAKPAASPKASPSPAALPEAPLLIRMDTAAGWPKTCHGVIAVRQSTVDAPRQLIDDGACDTLPQWSPDRKSFAFTRSSAAGSAVWVARADGSKAREVAPVAGGRVSWSPDGTRLAVLRKEAGVQQLFLVDVLDGTARQVTTGSRRVEDPAWSPDGDSIAICLETTPGNWQIHLVDPDAPGRAPQQLTDLPHPALDPVWSPDGDLFAYTAGAYGSGSKGDIRLIGTDGTGDRALVATSAHEMDPNWSSDGSWVAFVRGPYEKPVIWAVRADGSGQRALTTGSVPEGHPAWR